MSEFLIESSKFVKNMFPESAEVGFGKTVVFKNQDNKVFLGILLKDSVFIPLGTKEPSNEVMSNMIRLNKSEITPNPRESTGENVAHKLGLPFNGQTYGLYSDGQIIGPVYGLHLYFREHHDSAETMFEDMAKILDGVNVKASIVK